MSDTELRVGYAFELISKANTVTVCSLDEMQSVVMRALRGEFDADIPYFQTNKKRYPI